MLQEQESGTDSASEEEDQIGFARVYSLSMDCLSECIERIPEKDQHALLMELCSSFSDQQMINVVRQKRAFMSSGKVTYKNLL